MPVPRHRSRNVVLHQEVTPSAVRAVAEQNGWIYHGQIESDPEKGTFYEVRWDLPRGGTVHYIVDEVADCVYLVVRHDDRAIAEHTADEVATQLRSWTLQEMVHDFDVNIYSAGWEKALLRLGAGAPIEQDDEVDLRIRESVQHKNERIRLTAVWAMVYTEWPVFRDLLSSMRDTDSDPEVARAAAHATELLDGATGDS